MIKPINVNLLHDMNVLSTNISNAKYKVYTYLDENEEKIEEYNRYSGIFRHDILQNKMEKFQFVERANSISITGTGVRFLFYASVLLHGKKLQVQIRKLDFIHFIDIEVFNIEIGQGNPIVHDYLLEDISLYNVNDQYVILNIPRKNNNQNIVKYLDMSQKKEKEPVPELIVIDIVEDKAYPVSCAIGQIDSLLRFKYFHHFKYLDETYLAVKTGTDLHEKKDIWEESNYKEVEEYFDDTERYILFPLETFIQDVKKGIELTTYQIVTCSTPLTGYVYHRVLLDEGIILAQKNDIKNEMSILEFYDISTREKKKVNFNGLYRCIHYTNDKNYWIQRNVNKEIWELYDSTKSKVIYTSSPQQVCTYISEKYIIYANIDWVSGVSREYTVYLHEIENSEIHRLGKCNDFNFDSELEILTLFNWN